jgi:hypothetical protein
VVATFSLWTCWIQQRIPSTSESQETFTIGQQRTQTVNNGNRQQEEKQLLEQFTAAVCSVCGCFVHFFCWNKTLCSVMYYYSNPGAFKIVLNFTLFVGSTKFLYCFYDSSVFQKHYIFFHCCIGFNKFLKSRTTHTLTIQNWTRFPIFHITSPIIKNNIQTYPSFLFTTECFF